MCDHWPARLVKTADRLKQSEYTIAVISSILNAPYLIVRLDPIYHCQTVQFQYWTSV